MLRDVTAVRELSDRLAPLLVALQQDVYYGSIVLHEDNAFTQATYYLSDGARDQEFKDLPDDVSALHLELMSLRQNCSVTDLSQHWPYAPH